MNKKLHNLRFAINKALAALAAALLLAPAAQGQSVQTLLSIPGGEITGAAVDLSDNSFYTLWDGAGGVNPIVKYNRYLDTQSGLVDAADGVFISPSAAVVARGGLIVADTGLAQLQWVDLVTGAASDLCPARFAAPSALAADPAGNLYVADANGVYKLDITNRLTTLGNNWSQPAGIAVDNVGQVWVSDAGDDVIKLIRISGTNATVTVAAGKQGMPGFTDSTRNARFNAPGALFWAGGQTGLLVADYGNNAIRNVSYDGVTNYPVSTIATNLSGPDAVIIDNEGTIIVADSKAGALRAITRSGQPAPVMTPAGGSFSNALTVAFSTGLSQAYSPVFHYTLDGSMPTQVSPSGLSAGFDGAPGLNSARQVQMRCFSPDLATSITVSNTYSFYVSAPVINPAGGTNNNTVVATLSTLTTGAALYWTLDGSEPSQTNGNLYAGPITVTSSGSLKVKGVKPGYADSATSSQFFDFVVAVPVISSAGNTGSNDIPVTISCATTNARIYYTTDGTDPAQNSPLYTGAFLMNHSGAVKARAFRDGFDPSQIAAAAYTLTVADPLAFPAASTAVNSMSVSLTDFTSGAILHYTLDGSTPGAASAVYSGPITITTNVILSVVALRDGCVSSAVIVNTYLIQVDTPVMTPPGGYFPNGSVVSLAVQRADAVIYYTLNGLDPTNTDTLYTGPFEMEQVPALGDLRTVRARAFAPSTVASAVVSGQSATTNSVGVPRDMLGGIGSTLVVPVVADIATNQQIRSLQFRFEVTPLSAGAPPLTDLLDQCSVSTNDFAQVAGDSSNSQPVTNSYAAYATGVTNGIEFLTISGNFLLQNYGLVANFKLKVPKTAKEGDTYKLSILGVSGTSDNGQNVSTVVPLPPRTLTVSNISYLAGDCSIGGWYNAGDFGGGTLDNADVNMAIDASLGLRVPYSFSDAFNAMDVYPEGPTIVGDGLITFLDWEHILQRSLGLETNNWARFWTNGGVLAHRAVPPPGSAAPQRLLASAGPKSAQSLDAETNSISPATNLWLRHALIVAQTVTNLAPGAMCSMPVYINVLPGFNVAGLQFRAVCAPVGNAPQPGPVQFACAAGVPATRSHPVSSALEAACIWPLDSLSQPLRGSNLLGYVQFQIPAGAQYGQSYSVQLLWPDGAADYQTPLSLESAAGRAWVLSAPAVMPRVVSDQWKTNFFGSIDNPDADGEADPDQDGVPNWQEYLAGTNPTNALSRLEFSSANLQAGRVALGWQGVTGRAYVIESSSALGGAWTPVLTNVCAQGSPGVLNGSFPAGNSQFYRIRLQQP
jgi:hypothetical protein